MKDDPVDSTAPYKDRLELAMAEAHHRVKNTLQNIISYINIMFAKKDVVGKEEIQKLTHYIQSLSSLHDLLLQEVKSRGDGKMINMDRIIHQIIELQSLQKMITCSEIPEMPGPPRRAATLSLVLNELIDYFSSFGSTELFLNFELKDEQRVVMTLREGTTDSDAIDHAAALPQGLQVAALLTKSDLQSTFEWIQSNRPMCMQLKIPLNN